MSQRERKSNRHAIVVVGGVAPNLAFLETVDPESAVVVAADSGAVHAIAAKLSIDFAVGDFDSIPAGLLAELERTGVTIERHPAMKDATDLELAIEVALREGADIITVVGGHGGRVDQSFANALVIASPAYSHVEMHAVLDQALVSVVHGGGRVALSGTPGDVVTILALHGDAVGISSKGLEYGLDRDTLRAGSTRGVSNVFLDDHAEVSLDHGTIIVVRPGPEIFVASEGENQ